MREKKLILALVIGISASATFGQNHKIASCNFETPQPRKEKQAVKTRGFIGNSNSITNVYELESRPGAPFTILLDFDGNGSDGKSAYGGFGNNSYTVSGASDAYVKKIWEHMAEDFIAFNVNVTTNQTVFNEYKTNERIIAAFAEFGLPGWKGIAYVGSFGNGNAALIDIAMNPPTNDASVDARVGSHEVGHSLGLSHDGGGGDPYYSGHGEYVPIMGSGSKDVTHWSKGEYSSATNHEDDVSIIAQTLDYVNDDIEEFKELVYSQDGTVSVEDNYGTITSRADKDLFKFEMANAGTIDLTVSTSISWSNLDVRFKLLDANKSVLQSVNPVGKRSATISTSIPSAGTYYLEIDGDSELSVNTGWSDYSSMGYFEISGKINGADLIKHDAELNTVSGFGNVCQQSIQPQLTISNKGTVPVNAIECELFIDNIFFRSETIKTSLQPGSTEIYQLEELLETGQHEIRIQIAIQNENDQITFNNSLSTSYHLIQGKEFQFNTNYQEFNGSNPFYWQVIDQNSGKEIIHSKNIETIHSSEVQQDFCLSESCYQFKMTGDFDPCLAYTPYSSGTYNGGETVALNGNLYKAKWWTSNQPPSSEWEILGPCPSVNARFEIKELSSNEVVIHEPSSALNGSYSNTFCVDLLTSSGKDESHSSFINIYPNPATDILNVVSKTKIEYITIYSMRGEVIWNEIIQSNSKNISLSNLSNGIYTIQIKTNGKVKTQLIMKK